MREAAGFTLIELMVVMAIMAILVGVVLPGVTGAAEGKLPLAVGQRAVSVLNLWTAC